MIQFEASSLNEALGPRNLAEGAPLSSEEESLLAESGDLDADIRKMVLRLCRLLDHADHYQLLGIERTASRKDVKRAYFDLAAKLHPDRYFRKKLGSFKDRMETVFARLTLAHDTLGNAKQRADYDIYLEERRRSRSIEDLLADALAEVRRAEEVAEKEARAAAATPVSVPPLGAPSVAPGAPVDRAAPASAPPAPPKAPPAPRVPAEAQVDVAAAARRDALARRLLGGRARSFSSASQPTTSSSGLPPAPASPSTPPRGSADDAMAALKRRYEERKSLAKAAQVRSYVDKGQQALAAGDAIAAANAFRVAVSLAPEDPEVERVARQAQAKADELLAATYERQAQYEERNGQWAEAARSWGRVCRGRPDDASAHDRAAHAILKGGGDLHEAGRLAQRACNLKPDGAPYRLTLANVYMAAGMTLNAKRELETAAQFAPQDGTIAAMLKRIGKSA